MELQWPLVIFTTLIAWSAGLFSAQCVAALKGKAPKAQMPSWVIAAVLLVVGGVAVLFHLQHWERIFNGFGHLTSGITQELIAVVVLGVCAIVYLALMRRNGNQVPSWIAIVGIVVSVMLVVVMAHSYMMPARPAWDTAFWALAIVGNACVLGPATFALIVAAVGEDGSLGAQMTFAGSIVNAVTSVCYVIAAHMATSSFTQVGSYFDPTHPTKALVDAASLSPFSSENLLVVIAGVLVVGVAVPVVCGLLAKKQAAKTWCALALACAFVGALCLRVAFYGMGASVFMFY